MRAEWWKVAANHHSCETLVPLMGTTMSKHRHVSVHRQSDWPEWIALLEFLLTVMVVLHQPPVTFLGLTLQLALLGVKAMQLIMRPHIN